MEKTAEFRVTLCKSVDNGEIDKLSQLPDDIIFLIMHRLTTKEAAQLSVLSHKWNKLWASYPGILNFDDPMTLYERRETRREAWDKRNETLVKRDTTNFVRWITRVVEQHVGLSLEQFKVAFDLDNSHQCDIDKWVVFALSKGVTSLELEFNANEIIEIKERNFYSMPLKCVIKPRSLPNPLKTLVLSHVEITAQVLDCFLQSCIFLEKLRMRKVSSLGSIRASHSLPALKHFDVSDTQLESIDISAPKLFVFRYHGCSIKLNIRNAMSLSEVSLGDDREHPTHTLESLSQYFPQLEYLHLSSDTLINRENVNLPPVSNLTNVTHLKLTIKGYKDESISGWFTLIEASPVLQKLTVELILTDFRREVVEEKHSNPRPLKCLRKMELYGFVGIHIDLELVTYVIENAAVLEEVFIDLKGFDITKTKLNEEKAETEFKEKLQSVGAKLVISNRYQEHNFMYSSPMNGTHNFFNEPPRGMLRRISKAQVELDV